MQESAVNYEWQTTFSAGTLFRDDLELIEQIVGGERTDHSWSLSGSRELGTASIRAARLSDLADARLEVPNPQHLRFATGRAHDYDGSQQGQIWMEMETSKWGTPAINVTVGGHSGSSQKFDQVVRGLSERFAAASIRTDVQRPDHWLARARLPLRRLGLVFWIIFALAAWMPITVRVFDLGAVPTQVDSAASIVLAVFFVLWCAISLVNFRIGVLSRWKPAGPLFDLSQVRSAAPTARPPTFWQGELGRFWLAFAVGTGLALAGIALSIYYAQQ